MPNVQYCLSIFFGFSGWPGIICLTTEKSNVGRSIWREKKIEESKGMLQPCKAAGPYHSDFGIENGDSEVENSYC